MAKLATGNWNLYGGRGKENKCLVIGNSLVLMQWSVIFKHSPEAYRFHYHFIVKWYYPHQIFEEPSFENYWCLLSFLCFTFFSTTSFLISSSHK